MSTYKEARAAHDAATDASRAADKAYNAVLAMLDSATALRDAAQEAWHRTNVALIKTYPPLTVTTPDGVVQAHLTQGDQNVLQIAFQDGQRVLVNRNSSGGWGAGFFISGINDADVDAAITALRALEAS